MKIADFGLIRGFGLLIKNFSNDVVSLWYRAPKILLGNEIMVNGGFFFQGYSEKEQIQKIFKMFDTINIKEIPI